MSDILTDTGPLYAAYDPSDRYHSQALAEIDRLAEQDIHAFVPYPILLETHSLILKRLGIPIGFRFLDEISAGATLIQPTIADYRAATEILQHFSDQTITLFDATTAAIAQRLNLSVWTYDFHFDVIGVAIWNRGRE
ncbi:MAG TPA: PIN domain-containing protein [Coleofasciculaceae cyanobacterium]